MGLRFRKSVKICNGLRLNFGKTGMSMTVGSGPLKKTFSANGNVTTTVGIPGTGIYWTETERRGSKNNGGTQNTQPTSAPQRSWQNDYQAAPAIDDHFMQSDTAEEIAVVPAAPAHNMITARHGHSPSEPSASVDPNGANGSLAEAIKKIYLYEDAPVDWTELIAGATAEDLLMDQTVHAYCAQMAPRVLSGDVDAYLEVIERMRPVDDMALYCGNFEFGTDKPSYIEVEFAVNPERVLQNHTSDALSEEFVSAVAIRVARDLFALLPVAKVLVHVEIQSNTVLSVAFSKHRLCSTNFRSNSAAAIIQTFPNRKVDGHSRPNGIERMRL